MDAKVKVLTNHDLVHYISSFYRRRECLDHSSNCVVNLKYKKNNNNCKKNKNKECDRGHILCAPAKWGEFQKGDSAAKAGYLNVIQQFNDQLLFSEKAMNNAATRIGTKIVTSMYWCNVKSSRWLP